MRIKFGLLLSVALVAALCSAQTSSSKTRLTPEQAISLRRLHDLRTSPDGTRVAFTLVEPAKGTEHHSHIWIYFPTLRELRQFTNSNKTESHPRWSPDGKKLAFLSEKDEFNQILVIPTDGGEALPLTEGKRSIDDFEWSPDGKRIGFLAKDPKTDDEERKDKEKDDARSIDRDDKRTHLWLADASTGKAQKIGAAPWEFSQLQWFPGGDRLLVVATDHPESDQETKRIFTVGVPDGKMQQVAAPRGPFILARVSPDGQQISYVGCRVDGPAPHDLYLLPAAGGRAVNLTANSIDRPVEGYRWRSDGKLLALARNGFRSQFYVVDANAHAEALASPEMSASAISLSSSGGAMSFVGEATTQPQELWQWDGKRAPQSVSRFNESLAKFAVAAPEFVRYKSFDGREIEAALLKPANYVDNSKLPTVLVIHGGPTGNWEDAFESWGQLLVSAGFVVLYPNVRGSTGYGYDFMVLNRADWGGGDFKDVMAGVDYLVSRGIADPNRLGIAGWSYGGYMAAWAITQTPRFKAAVSGAGMSDLAQEYGTEEHPSYDEWFYGLPYEKPEGFHKSSPINYIRNAHTPTLILQGEADTVDPLGQSQQLYRALKRYGVPAELVVYPREGHPIREEKHQIDRLNRIVAWFDRYLK
jgi:dipeptidyl aminopeptidase/acylaminoacyl peptidase